MPSCLGRSMPSPYGGGKSACGKDEMGPNGKRASGLWSAYQAIEHICYGQDWDDDVAPFSPPSNFLTDIENGELRAVTWITPTNRDSTTAAPNSAAGPSWVASLVNAIGESQVLEFSPRSSSFGTIPAAGTIRSRRSDSTTTTMTHLGTGFRCSSSRLTRKKATLTTRTTNTAPS